LTPTVALAACGVAGTIYGAWLLRWARSHEWRDPRPTPRPVLVAFVVFVVALLLVGGALAAQVPGILPWKVTPQLSTLFGLMFLGAATYFVYALLDRRWENAGGQLAGFLAYDIVLVLPFLLRLPTVEATLLPNLVVYLAVVIVSGILAAWYLLLNPMTRVRLRAGEAAPATVPVSTERPA
jgi:H+/Cl- antiporter ClcA